LRRGKGGPPPKSAMDHAVAAGVKSTRIVVPFDLFLATIEV
jgi:hypothetical protein